MKDKTAEEIYIDVCRRADPESDHEKIIFEAMELYAAQSVNSERNAVLDEANNRLKKAQDDADAHYNGRHSGLDLAIFLLKSLKIPE